MSDAKTVKAKAKSEPEAAQQTHFVEDAMRMLKNKYNWKFFLGFILGWIVEYLVCQ